MAAANLPRVMMILYDGALRVIADGGSDLVVGRIAENAETMAKMIGIIDDGLKASLDRTPGAR